MTSCCVRRHGVQATGVRMHLHDYETTAHSLRTAAANDCTVFVQSRPGAPSCALCFPRLAHIMLEKHGTLDFVWILSHASEISCAILVIYEGNHGLFELVWDGYCRG